MTADQITQLAQSNPTLNLSTRLGELKVQADKEIARLAQTLAHIDETTDLLKDHGVHMTLDLGDVGNAAQNARRAQVTDSGARTYTQPKAAA